jgi:flagellar protein FlaG
VTVENLVPSSSPSSRYVVSDGSLVGRQVDVKDRVASVQRSDEFPRPGKEEIKHSLAKAEEVAQAFDRQIRFRFREEADEFQVEVLEKDGSEEKVIRKIPPDSVINFIEHVQEMFGALIDVEA